MRPWQRNDGGTVASTLFAADSSALLPEPHEVSSPVLRVILERARAASRPRRRTDDHVVSLAIEGGGMRGAVSAGMCVVLEAAGLVGSFDRIYGVSAGALNGSFTAAAQAALGATSYQDAATRAVINPLRALTGRPVVDYDHLFRNLIAARKPVSFGAYSSGPEFRALATSVETLALRVLKDFSDTDDLMRAVRASATLPTLAGGPTMFHGEPMLDGGLIEAIPFETAVREGATHVLVLRSRPAAYRKSQYGHLAERLALGRDRALNRLVRDGADAYNHQAAELERATASHDQSCLLQIAVPNHAKLIGRLEVNAARVVEALRMGAAAMGAALLTAPIDLCWQPVAYRAAYVEAPEPELPPRPIRRWPVPIGSGEARA